MEVEIDRNRCGVKRRERSANQYEDQHHQRVDDSHGQVPETGDQTAIFQNLLRDGFKRFPNKHGKPDLPANRQSLPTTADALFTRRSEETTSELQSIMHIYYTRFSSINKKNTHHIVNNL